MMNPSDSRRAPDIIERIRLRLGSRLSLFVLIGLGIVISCAWLVPVAHYEAHIQYGADRLPYALVAVTAFSTVSLLFVFARFSFGYFIGFSLFTMMLGFIWLNSFSKFNYDHRLASLSAAASALLFLLPALLINAPVKQAFALTPRGLQHLLKFILLLALGTIVAASFYNFRLVSITPIYDFRNDLNFPLPIRYLTGIVSTALLPFAFADCLALNRHWLAWRCF